MTAQAKTKSDQIFDDIKDLFFRKKKPDQLTLARIKNEVKKLLKVNAGEGHGLLGMIACLEVDVASCKRHHEAAIKLTNDVVDYINYIKSLTFLGLSKEAYQEIENALNIFPCNPDLITLAIKTAIYSGHPSDVHGYYERLSKINQNIEDTEIIYYMYLAERFSQANITHDVASSLLQLADGLVVKNGLHSFSKTMFTDDIDSNSDIYWWIEIDANPAKVVEMNMELCEQIANDPYFCDKNTFSIAYRCR